MANYLLDQTGAEVQAILNAVQAPDTTPVEGSTKLITSGGVQAALAGTAQELNAEVAALGQEVDELLGGRNTPDADLDIADEDGNVLVRFAAGNIQTKKFDSKTAPKGFELAGDADLDIIDPFGNVLTRFAGGSIKVKDFDSSYIPALKVARNTMWSWWTSPLSILTKHNYRRKLIWGYCDTEMNIGVCERDEFGSGVRRTNLAIGTQQDDHNAPAVFELPDGRIAVVYTKGHNAANGVFYRISTNVGDTSDFGAETKITTPNNEKTAYAQVLNVNGTYCIFTRFDSNDWAITTSVDFSTWTPMHVFLDSDVQYYVKFAKVTDQPNVIRFAAYSNPVVQYATGIRLGLIDFSSGNIYNGTISPANIVGTLSGSAVLYTSFSEIIATPESPSRNRLLDIADSPLARVLVAYATFTNTDTDDGEYYIYDNGVSTNLCPCGEAFYMWKYQGGISFINQDNIVISRNDSGKDIIELWANRSGTWSVTEVLRRENVGGFPVRNIRPIADGAQMFVLWLRGFYDSTDYQNFDMDTIIKAIDSKLQ